MYLGTGEICENYGLNGYEVSNYARKDAESQHNQIYWRYGDYGGIGPGAHARLTLNGQRTAFHTELDPRKWLESVKNKGHGMLEPEVLPHSDQAIEYLLMSMRLKEGSDLTRYNALAGQPLAADRLRQLQELDMVIVEGKMLKTTDKGRVLLNSILSELLG